MGKVKVFKSGILMLIIILFSCKKQNETNCKCCSVPIIEYRLDSSFTRWLIKLPFDKLDSEYQVRNAFSSDGLSESFTIQIYDYAENKFSQAIPDPCDNSRVHRRHCYYSSSLYHYKMNTELSFADGFQANFFNAPILDRNKLLFLLTLQFNKKNVESFYRQFKINFYEPDTFRYGYAYGDFVYRGKKYIGLKLYNDIFELRLNFNTANDYLKYVYVEKTLGIVGFAFNDGSEWYIDYP